MPTCDQSAYLARARELLDYNPETGEFTWRVTRGGTAWAGTKAGAVDKNGYVNIRIDRKLVKAHRLAWLLTTGQWPSKDIDHVNGKKTDNSANNLREATDAQNVANSNCRKDSVLGLRGVRLAGGCKNRWVARITENGKRRVIGRYSSPDAAYAAYCDAARKHFGQYSRV